MTARGLGRVLTIVAYGALIAASACDDSDMDDDDTATDDDTMDDDDTADDDIGDDDTAPDDIADQLAAIEGMTVTERSTNLGGRLFELVYEQPVDHGDPDGPTFDHHVTLLHRDVNAPVVLAATGYYNFFANYETEITAMLGANQLSLEKRYHGDSVPQDVDWTTMTIDQIAADAHRIVEAIAPLYGGAWIGTGPSMGGMDSIYHRQRYPGDVVGTVAYVAPFLLGNPDDRFEAWFASALPGDCQGDLERIQVEMLGQRRGAMLDRAEAEGASMSFELVGGVEPALETTVISLPWVFWQYHSSAECAGLPGTGASDSEVWAFYQSVIGISGGADSSWELFAPFFYQVYAELGYPEIPVDHLAGLIDPQFKNYEEGYLPEGAVEPAYDNATNAGAVQWVQDEAAEVIFVYGEYDPWTGGAVDVTAAGDVWAFTAPGGSHHSVIYHLEAADQAFILDRLEQWTAVAPAPPVPREPDPGITARDPARI